MSRPLCGQTRCWCAHSGITNTFHRYDKCSALQLSWSGCSYLLSKAKLRVALRLIGVHWVLFFIAQYTHLIYSKALLTCSQKVLDDENVNLTTIWEGESWCWLGCRWIVQDLNVNAIHPHLEKVHIYIRLCLVKNLSDTTYLQIAGSAFHLFNASAWNVKRKDE